MGPVAIPRVEARRNPHSMNPSNSTPFVSCDWGTSNFRLRTVGSLPVREVRHDSGAAKLADLGGDRAESFRSTLRAGLQELGAPDHCPVIISGMASSTIGWKELPYAPLPFALDGSSAVIQPIEERVYLVSGIRGASEMARGEETQAIGLAAQLGSALPDHALFLLPGTHSKHLTVHRGQIVALRTFMTGELFELLTRHSVLRHTTDPGAAFDSTAFTEGVETSSHHPLLGALFQTRTRQVLNGKSSAANASFLSGLLIGNELSHLAAESAGLPPLRIYIAAGETLRTSYQRAALTLGLESRIQCIDSDSLTALGQQVLLSRLNP